MVMTWRDFEKRVEDACKHLDSTKVRVAQQLATVHGGVNKRYDIHIAERRQGGRSIVLDAKHFSKPLPTHEIQTTLQYKVGGRASAVAVIISSTTEVSDAASKFAEKNGVTIIHDVYKDESGKAATDKANQALASNIKEFVKLHLPHYAS